MEVEESSDSQEAFTESEEEASEAEMRLAPNLVGESELSRSRGSARVELDRVRDTGVWEQDYYPSDQAAGAAGLGSSSTPGIIMPPRSRPHSQGQRID
jgi:hypothetical protein